MINIDLSCDNVHRIRDSSDNGVHDGVLTGTRDVEEQEVVHVLILLHEITFGVRHPHEHGCIDPIFQHLCEHTVLLKQQCHGIELELLHRRLLSSLCTRFPRYGASRRFYRDLPSLVH